MDKKNNYLVKPYNPTDPVVVIDPEFNSKVILKQYDDPENAGLTDGKYDSLKDDAINIPIIRLNNITLNDSQIDFVELYFNDFLPKIHLSIKDSENVIKICDTPGFENEIHIVITCDINGYYKKISLLFYITNFNVYGDYIAYDGIFKLQSINQHEIKQIGKGKLNTYDMLYEIAKENKLGFAATEHCKDIKDERYRLIQKKTFIQYIKDQIEIGGLDEESLFDAWIDMFGYITLINVNYVFNIDIKPNQLMVYSMVGLNEFPIHNESTEIQAVELPRTITNNKINPAQTNMQFDNFETIINNNKIIDEGCFNTNYYMSSPCKENKINIEQTQIIENSPTGMNNSDKYVYSKTNFLGIEFGETPILFQKHLHKRYFDKLRTKQIKIELEKVNFGLQRGTLLNIIFKEYNSTVIKLMNNENSLENDDEGIVNTFLSGIYYIDSITFEYYTEKHKIKQYLYVIKKSVDLNVFSSTNGPNI